MFPDRTAVIPWLREAAERALLGVGDASLGEFREGWTGKAYHLRRRLSLEEQERYVGPVVDVRGTEEADRRMEKVLRRYPWAPTL